MTKANLQNVAYAVFIKILKIRIQELERKIAELSNTKIL